MLVDISAEEVADLLSAAKPGSLQAAAQHIQHHLDAIETSLSIGVKA